MAVGDMNNPYLNNSAQGGTTDSVAGGATTGGSMGGPWGAVIGAVAGLLKSKLVDKPKEDQQRILAAQTAKYSPWTHMQPNQVQEANPFGSAMQGAGTGAALGQGFQSSNSQDALQKAQLERLQQQNAWFAQHPDENPDPRGYGGGQ